MIGNVMIFNASLKFCCKNIVENRYAMTELLNGCCNYARLSIRRFVNEEYRKPKGARTLVAFLNESHAVLTTYPESKTVEIEIASCREFDFEEVHRFLLNRKAIKKISFFVIKKDSLGEWTRLRNI